MESVHIRYSFAFHIFSSMDAFHIFSSMDAFHIFSNMDKYGSHKMSFLGDFQGFSHCGGLIWAGFCSFLGLLLSCFAPTGRRGCL
jgi:hypothetical protein